MKKHLWFSLLGLVLGPFAAADQTYNYPKDDSVFSITFPDKWKVEEEEDSLSASPEDESVTVELLALEADDPEAALAEAKKDLGKEFEKFKADEPQKGEMNGLKVTLFNAKAEDEDGNKFNINCAMFVPPKSETFFVLFFIAPPEASEKHGEDLGKILQSIKGKDAAKGEAKKEAKEEEESE